MRGNTGLTLSLLTMAILGKIQSALYNYRRGTLVSYLVNLSDMMVAPRGQGNWCVGVDGTQDRVDVKVKLEVKEKGRYQIQPGALYEYSR